MLSKLLRACGLIVATGLISIACTSLSLADDKSLIEKATGAPDWLTIRGSHRTRFEVLDGINGFGALRPGNSFGDVVGGHSANATSSFVSLQSSLFAEAKIGRFRLVGELMDSRSYKPIDAFSPGAISPRTNAVEPIQAFVAYNFGDQSAPHPSEVVVGRFTMDLGSGRLVARSEFRNTIQSYHGVKANFGIASHDQLTLFYTLPTARRFEDDNEVKYDTPVLRRHFWGAHYENTHLIKGATIEAYVFGQYGTGVTGCGIFFSCPSSLNGLQFTPGARFYKAPQPKSFDFDIEAAAQVRNNRFSSVSHFGQNIGFFSHAEVGLTLDRDQKFRIAALLDVASGSADNVVAETVTVDVPSGGQVTSFVLDFQGTAAFDPLFGDFSHDFGPEGLFGLLSRTNIISPAGRIEFKPSDRFAASLTYRAARQLEPAFQFTRFNNGASTDLITQRFFSGWAHQLDTRAQYWIVPKRLRVELGGAVFTQKGVIGPVTAFGFSGSERDRENTFYGYTSITANF